MIKRWAVFAKNRARAEKKPLHVPSRSPALIRSPDDLLDGERLPRAFLVRRRERRARPPQQGAERHVVTARLGPGLGPSQGQVRARARARARARSGPGLGPGQGQG